VLAVAMKTAARARAYEDHGEFVNRPSTVAPLYYAESNLFAQLRQQP
jgi:hypothetical protein